MSVPVRSDLEAYRVAIAELPQRTRAVSGIAGSVVALSGAGEWWAAASDAVAQGAAAVVVAQPDPAPVEAIDALAAHAGGRPVVLERPLLRPDAAAAVSAALTAAAALVVECQAPAGALPAALQDAIGWARILARTPLRHLAGDSWGGRLLALLESAGHEPVSIVAATQAGAPPRGRVRLTALAETLVEIDGDVELVIALTDAAGRRTLPARFERPERLALRRAIEAAAAGHGTPDLRDLRHDRALALAILSTPSP